MLKYDDLKLFFPIFETKSCLEQFDIDYAEF